MRTICILTVHIPEHFANRRCRQECLTKWLFNRQRIGQLENCCTVEFEVMLGLLALFAASIELGSRRVDSPGSQRNLEAFHR